MVEKKEKQKVPRQKMPEQEARRSEPGISTKFLLGIQPELAQLESSRCLQCKKPKCIEGCPVEIDIPGLCEADLRGRLYGSSAEAERAKQPSCGLRPGLSPGRPVRKTLHRGEERMSRSRSAGWSGLPRTGKGRRERGASFPRRRLPQGRRWLWSDPGLPG